MRSFTLLGAFVSVLATQHTAHAQPYETVTKTLSAWEGYEGTVWEMTDGNKVTDILHTPIDVWGIDPADRAQANRTTDCSNAHHACKDDDGRIGLCQVYEFGRRTTSDPSPMKCGRHSDEILNQVWSLISGAKHQVDITTLWEYDQPSLDGNEEFYEAVRNAIHFAANDLASENAPDRALTIRVLFGDSHSPPGWQFLTKDKLKRTQAHVRDRLAYFMDGLDPRAAKKIRLLGGIYHPSLMVWNHAKIIAVDGKRALVGGHNLWGDAYTYPSDPVHDLSIVVEGSAARSAHKYANRLWDVVCSAPTPDDVPGTQSVWEWDPGTDTTITGLDFEYPTFVDALLGYRTWFCKHEVADVLPPIVQQDSPGNTKIISVGKTGLWAFDSWFMSMARGSGENPSDDALAALIRGAEKTLMLSQQKVTGPERKYVDIAFDKLDIDSLPDGLKKSSYKKAIEAMGVQGQWTSKILDEIANAAARDVDVRIIISAVKNDVRQRGYASKGAKSLLAEIAEHWPQGASLDKICNIRVAQLRDANTHPAANHVKLVMVDPYESTGAYYVGSQNLYGNDLSEFGYIVFGGSDSAPQHLALKYWQPAWESSAGAGDALAIRDDRCH